MSSIKQPRSIVYYTFSGEGPLTHLRILSPNRQLGIKLIKGVENNRIHIQRVVGSDLVIIQRDFPREYDSYKAIVKAARSLGIPVILDIDDWLFDLPQDHPDRISNYFTESLFALMEAAMEVDLITVSTPEIKRHLAGFGPELHVLPNYLDENLWHIRPPIDNDSQEKVIIGYMGGHSHTYDFDLITPLLERLLKKYPTLLQLEFWGMEPPLELASLNQVRYKAPENLNYEDFAKEFLKQAVDIFIAPLIDNTFNGCKSSIKYLEYSALGVPGVYSRVKPYEMIIQNGQNGFLASNEAEWEYSLTKLIENPRLRYQIASKAQKTLKANWLLSKNAYRWMDTYTDALLRHQPSKRVSKQSPINDIVKSLSPQFSSLISAQRKTNDALQRMVADQGIKNEELQRATDSLKRAVSEKNARIEDLHQEIETLKKQLFTLSEAINRIQNSFGYKVLIRFRKYIDKLLPHNSVRRRGYEFIHVGLRKLVRNNRTTSISSDDQQVGEFGKGLTTAIQKELELSKINANKISDSIVGDKDYLWIDDDLYPYLTTIVKS